MTSNNIIEAARVEPFADGSRGHLADLRDLACCENLHHFDSMWIIRVRNCPGQPATTEQRNPAPHDAEISSWNRPRRRPHEGRPGSREGV